MSLSTPFRQQLIDKWRELTLSLSGLAIVALLQKFGDAVFDSAANTIGKTLLLQIVSLLFLSCAYLGWRVYRHGKEKPQKPEVVRIVAGVEFRYGDRTGRQWLPFCPKCNTAIYPQRHEFAGFACHAGCGWHSPISADEIWEIASKGK